MPGCKKPISIIGAMDDLKQDVRCLGEYCNRVLCFEKVNYFYLDKIKKLEIKNLENKYDR